MAKKTSGILLFVPMIVVVSPRKPTARWSVRLPTFSMETIGPIASKPVVLEIPIPKSKRLEAKEVVAKIKLRKKSTFKMYKSIALLSRNTALLA